MFANKKYGLTIMIRKLSYLRVRIDSTIAYSIIALKILKMQVTIKLSIAFSLLDAAAGALALK